MTHTKGPWVAEDGHIQRDSGGIRYWQISDGQDAIACNQFCYAGHDPAVNAANARLIAAAPTMLEALDKAAERECTWWCSDAVNDHTKACRTYRAAIALARGEAGK